MITYYYQPLPEIPTELVNYCNYHNYPLSLKKKYIIAQLINLSAQTDIDVVMLKTASYCNSISKSSIYLVLQWMIEHDLIRKTVAGDKLKVAYKTNFDKLSIIALHNNSVNHLSEYGRLAVAD